MYLSIYLFRIKIIHKIDKSYNNVDDLFKLSTYNKKKLSTKSLYNKKTAKYHIISMFIRL